MQKKNRLARSAFRVSLSSQHLNHSTSFDCLDTTPLPLSPGVPRDPRLYAQSKLNDAK
jgi:hypothetical protein